MTLTPITLKKLDGKIVLTFDIEFFQHVLIGSTLSIAMLWGATCL